VSDPCPFCGETHKPGPVGEPGSMFAGLEFKVCPRVPDGFIYMDAEFAHGPRGWLHRVISE
jgi:hypothetical protein